MSSTALATLGLSIVLLSSAVAAQAASRTDALPWPYQGTIIPSDALAGVNGPASCRVDTEFVNTTFHRPIPAGNTAVVDPIVTIPKVIYDYSNGATTFGARYGGAAILQFTPGQSKPATMGVLKFLAATKVYSRQATPRPLLAFDGYSQTLKGGMLYVGFRILLNSPAVPYPCAMRFDAIYPTTILTHD